MGTYTLGLHILYMYISVEHHPGLRFCCLAYILNFGDHNICVYSFMECRYQCRMSG